jgi:tRNA-2-methylthio-N6-dimethylallyladenosine synthase
MAYNRVEIPAQELERQREICESIRKGLGGAKPLAFVDTYGCQQNEADSEAIRGYIELMGFGFTEDENEAELIVVNTCAVRGHAEMRVLGNVGALVHAKARNPRLIVAVCGCMVQQPHMAEKIRKSFRVVDLCFGPHELWRFPELYERALRRRGRVFETSPCEGVVAEGLPVHRQGSVKAWLSIMYGCNNFCTYCIVPYVRGRERSRRPEDVVAEARRLVEAGYRDMTLLGQNVNSYGKDLGTDVDFADIIREINAIPGDFLIRFMTSHPRDATEKLFRTMAECEKCAKHIHLPVQSGSSRVLKAMNRHYDREKYLSLVDMARSYMPDIVLTTDIIVGFPGETAEDFEETMTLVERVRYDAMFTFIFSPREGTPAAAMPDPVSREEKQAWFDRLIETANTISGEKHREYIGRRLRVLVDGETGRGEYNLSARTNGGRLVHLKGSPELVGRFIEAEITDGNTWALYGVPAD